MLDLKYVIANVEAVKENCRNRNVAADILDDIDAAVALDSERKTLLHSVEEIRRKQNEIAQATGKEKDATKRSTLIEEGKRLKADVAELEERLRIAEAQVAEKIKRVPNLTHPDAPIGLT